MLQVPRQRSRRPSIGSPRGNPLARPSYRRTAHRLGHRSLERRGAHGRQLSAQEPRREPRDRRVLHRRGRAADGAARASRSASGSLGLRVENPAGGPIGLPRALVRTALLSLVLPAIVMNDEKRGLHDIAAGSRVIRVRERSRRTGVVESLHGWGADGSSCECTASAVRRLSRCWLIRTSSRSPVTATRGTSARSAAAAGS